MKNAAVYSLIALMSIASTAAQGKRQTAGSGSPRIRTLALVPAAIDAATEYTLLPDPNGLTAGDGSALYAQAAQVLPTNLNQQQIYNWLRLPLNELPQTDAQRVIQQAQASLQQVELATRCQDCQWPAFTPGTMPAHLKEYRTLAHLLCLKARLQIARGQHDEAVGTMRTGLAMARQVGDSPTVLQGMVGIAIAAITLRQVEGMAQSEDSPNLYAALAELPRPLVDLEKPIASELNNLNSNPQYNFMVRAAMRRQLKESHARVRQLMHRLDRDIAALACIEALRHYAATHDGHLPKQLADVTDTTVPANPETKGPFGYRLEGLEAILDAPAAAGGRPEDAVRYEITLAP